MRNQETITGMSLIAAALLLATPAVQAAPQTAPRTSAARRAAVVARTTAVPKAGSVVKGAATLSGLLYRLRGNRVVIALKSGRLLRGRLATVGTHAVVLSRKRGSNSVMAIADIRSARLITGREHRSWRNRPRALLDSDGDESSPQQVLRKLSGARARIAWGVVLLTVGLGGAIGSGMVAVSASRRSKQGGSCDTSWSLWGEPDEGNAERCDAKWRSVGFGALAVLAGAVALTGLVLTVQGGSRAAELSRALEKYRPRLTIDPARKSFSATMTVGF